MKSSEGSKLTMNTRILDRDDGFVRDAVDEAVAVAVFV
jgi:hypothetical protein